MVRGTWLSKSSKPHTYGLPPPLLAHLRAVLQGCDSELTPQVHEQDVSPSTLDLSYQYFSNA